MTTITCRAEALHGALKSGVMDRRTEIKPGEPMYARYIQDAALTEAFNQRHGITT
jgi:hypothetical protein